MSWVSTAMAHGSSSDACNLLRAQAASSPALPSKMRSVVWWEVRTGALLPGTLMSLLHLCGV